MLQPAAGRAPSFYKCFGGRSGRKSVETDPQISGSFTMSVISFVAVVSAVAACSPIELHLPLLRYLSRGYAVFCVLAGKWSTRQPQQIFDSLLKEGRRWSSRPSRIRCITFLPSVRSSVGRCRRRSFQCHQQELMCSISVKVLAKNL